jgi:hypothetical protein
LSGYFEEEVSHTDSFSNAQKGVNDSDKVSILILEFREDACDNQDATDHGEWERHDGGCGEGLTENGVCLFFHSDAFVG